MPHTILSSVWQAVATMDSNLPVQMPASLQVPYLVGYVITQMLQQEARRVKDGLTAAAVGQALLAPLLVCIELGGCVLLFRASWMPASDSGAVSNTAGPSASDGTAVGSSSVAGLTCCFGLCAGEG